MRRISVFSLRHVSLLLLLCAVSQASTVDPVKRAELICHSSDPVECYPRMFEASEEFQVIHDDQEIPLGLHVRLDISSGVKEGRLYDPASEDSDAQYGTIQVMPGEGPLDVSFDIDGLSHESRVESAEDLYGPIKAPSSFHADKPVFDAAVAAISHQSLPSNIDDLLEDLRDLTDNMYWGLELAKNSIAVQYLSACVARVSCDEDRSVLAARVLASAMRNNAPAANAILNYRVSTSSFSDGSVYEAVLHALRLTADKESPESRVGTRHVRADVSGEAYKRYLSLLSAILGGSATQRERAVPYIQRLASTQYFDGPDAGKDAQWDAVRKRLLQLITDHYISTETTEARGTGSNINGNEPDTQADTDDPSQRFTERCAMLRAWLTASEQAQAAWSQALHTRFGADEADSEANADEAEEHMYPAQMDGQIWSHDDGSTHSSPYSYLGMSTDDTDTDNDAVDHNSTQDTPRQQRAPSFSAVREGRNVASQTMAKIKTVLDADAKNKWCRLAP